MAKPPARKDTGGGTKPPPFTGTGLPLRPPVTGPVAPPRAPTPGFTPRTGGIPLPEADQAGWETWWAYNRAPWLHLKRTLYELPIATGSDDWIMGRGLKPGQPLRLEPSQADRRSVVSTLRTLLARTKGKREVVAAALLGIARARDGSDVRPIFHRYLRDGDALVAETAALAIGISGRDDCVPDLLHLAMCSDEGHRLCGGGHVPYRIRAFACYGLGVVAGQTRSPSVRKEVFEALAAVVDAPRPYRRDIKVAALHAIRQIRPGHSYAGRVLRHRILELLVDYWQRKKEPPQIRAHALAAAADVAGRTGAGSLTRKVTKLLERRTSRWLQQSAIQALGKLATPEDIESCTAVQDYLTAGKDVQARSFAAIALGEIGGDANRNALLTSLLSRRTPSAERPWLALGLAILDRHAREKDGSRTVDRTSAEAIRSQLLETRNAMYAAGFATALGLMRYTEAGEDLLARFLDVRRQQEAAGHIAIAIGLMGYREATDDLHAVVADSSRRPHLLAETAVALALLGSKRISQTLVASLRRGSTSSERRSIAQALGLVGDRRSIPVLKELLGDEKLGTRQKALTALSVGLVADVAPVPWNTGFALGVNYDARTETLTSPLGTGVLDIL